MGGQDNVIHYLGQQALYPGPVEPPSRAFEWQIRSSSPPQSNYKSVFLQSISRDHTSGFECRLAEATNVPEDWDADHSSFMQRLQGEGPPAVTRNRPTIHAELAMIMATDKGEIANVFPYIGVSKLSCIMCIHYIDAFNEATNQRITTKGSHGKAYPGWFWPELPNRDRELRPAFLKRMRKQLLEDFKVHARRLSDSSVGSGGTAWEKNEQKKDALKSWIVERDPWNNPVGL